MSKWLSQHLNIKHLHLHSLITGKNIYPMNFLPLFIFTYCFSTLTQITLDSSLLAFPTYCHQQVLSPCIFHSTDMQAIPWQIWKNSFKIKKTSSTSVLMMGVELQVSGHRTFVSSAMESSISSFWIVQVFWGKRPKPHNHQSSLRQEITEFLWKRENRQRESGITGSRVRFVSE